MYARAWNPVSWVAIAPALPSERLRRKRQESNFREGQRVTTLLRKIKRYEGLVEALAHDTMMKIGVARSANREGASTLGRRGDASFRYPCIASIVGLHKSWLSTMCMIPKGVSGIGAKCLKDYLIQIQNVSWKAGSRGEKLRAALHDVAEKNGVSSEQA